MTDPQQPQKGYDAKIPQRRAYQLDNLRRLYGHIHGDEIHLKVGDLPPHSCYDRAPFKPFYWTQNGYAWQSNGQGKLAGVSIWIKTPHDNTTHCRYTEETHDDPRCYGCKHRKIMPGEVL